MNPRYLEALSAFFDGEQVSSLDLVNAFRHPEALEFLAFAARLRVSIEQDLSGLSQSWCRVVRDRLAAIEHPADRACVPANAPANVPGGSCQVAVKESLRHSTNQSPTAADQHWLADRLALSSRETQVVEGMCRGESENEIARRLSISPATVHTYVKRAYSKLGVHRRLELLLGATVDARTGLDNVVP